MNPPPPRLPASGSTTASANPTATAASTALPPCWMISIPTWLASGWPDTIMACGPGTATPFPASAYVVWMMGGPVAVGSDTATGGVAVAVGPGAPAGGGGGV